MSATIEATVERIRTKQTSLGPAVLRRKNRVMFALAYRRTPPPMWSDLTGYEPIVRQLKEYSVADVPGDVLEIGAFFGGGSVKLGAHFLKHAPNKRVFVVDIFDAGFDATQTVDGRAMNALYADSLGGRDQRQIFDEVTAAWPNLSAIEGDSALVELPTNRLCFAMIDGNHDAGYVRSDFEMAWSRLSPGGVVALHDYGHDLPDVTHTINALIGEHAGEVAKFWTVGIVAFVQKERPPVGL